MVDNGKRTTSAAIRERLGHPIIDTDGHTLEHPPLAAKYMREVGGAALADTFLARVSAGGIRRWSGLSREQRSDMRVARPGFWWLPAARSVDHAALILPKLFRARLDDLGIDFAILYPTLGLDILHEATDPELRVGGCRALNRMYADLYGPHRDRMLVPALIPTGTPQEALEELEYATKTLGMKAVVLATSVRRPIAEIARKAPAFSSYATWMDVLAFGSDFDYDPVWKRCTELRVAVTSHSTSADFGFRTSPDSFVYNHVGSFAAANEAFCKALIFDGVIRRFPDLRFAFLESGTGWACSLYNDTIEHWETRNITAIRKYVDPANIDRVAMENFFTKYGEGKFEAAVDSQGSPILVTHMLHEREEDVDEWKTAEVDDPHQFATIFKSFFFGCNPRDRMTAAAFNARLNHYGVKLQAMFGSSIGRFDVHNPETAVRDAYQLVDDGLLDQEDFRAFAFENAARLYGKLNPTFFDGTSVEAAAKPVLVRA